MTRSFVDSFSGQSSLAAIFAPLPANISVATDRDSAVGSTERVIREAFDEF
jgi:hypothetical protein